MNDNLTRIVSGVRNGTETIATASAQIASGSHELSSRNEAQASALEQTAASMEELTSVVKSNAENSRTASDLLWKCPSGLPAVVKRRLNAQYKP